MEDWGEKLNQMAKDAVSKSKGVAEIARLNLEISALHQKIREIHTQTGAYVLEQGLFGEDASIVEWAAKEAGLKARVEADQAKINELKGIAICPGCGAAVSKFSKFCDKCGAAMVVKAPEPEEGEEVIDASYTETARKDAETDSEPKEG